MAGPGEEERLPWLEAYRETKAVKPAPVRKSRGGLWAGVAALGLLVAAGAGYIVGQRQPERVVPSAEISIAPVVPAPVEAAVAGPATAAVAEPVEGHPEVHRATPGRAARARPQRVARQSVRPRKIRSAGIESARLKEVRAAQEGKAAPPPVVHRAWPMMPSPGPAGQVIQLGAFKNPSGANRAYVMRVARYPLLGRMPRVVVPVVTRPDGRILYVLRLGTTSRQQSRIVCRNLRASGDHCLVIG